MRITCPNCLAQYEVEAELLAPEGRDVQCSACDHVWFQSAPMKRMLRPAAPQGAPKVAPPAPQPAPTPEPAPTPNPAPEMADEDTYDDPSVASDHPDTVSPAPGLRGLDPSVSEILKEEARFAEAARQRERENVETQPDLGLLGGNPWPIAARTDRADADADLAPDSADARPSSQAAFPDIDDVSATLEPLDKRRGRDLDSYELPATPKDRQRSFLGGFLVPIILGVVLIVLYLLAPTLTAAIPALAPLAEGYAGLIDTARAALVGMIGLGN